MEAKFCIKGNGLFYNAYFQKLFIWKKISVMEFLASTQGTKGTPKTVRWPCERIILTIGLFEGPTEVQLNSG